MEGCEGSSQTIMASKNDQLNLDIREERNVEEDSTESILQSYAGRLYDRVDMACHFNQCEQISHLNCQELYFYPCGNEDGVVQDQYNIPISSACEYCHATLQCRKDCQRPLLFSQKKRPPFASDEGWDEYDFPVVKEAIKQKPDSEQSKVPEPPKGKASKASWISGFFEKL